MMPSRCIGPFFFSPPDCLGCHHWLKKFKQSTLPGREDHLAGDFGHLTAKQRQQHYAPCDDRIDSNGAGEFLGAVMLVRFDTTTALKNPMPFFNTPTEGIPAQAAQRLLTRIDRHGCQQHPPQRFGTLGWMGFNNEQGVKFNRRQMSGLRCRRCSHSPAWGGP